MKKRTMPQLFQLETVSTLRSVAYSTIYCCFEINHGHLKETLKGHPIHTSASGQMVTPNYWGQCGKNNF